MGADIHFKKTTYSFYFLCITAILFTCIYQPVNSIYCANGEQIDRLVARYEPVCKRELTTTVLPQGFEGYMWEPDRYTEYKCVDEEDSVSITKDTQMCNFVGLKCARVETHQTKLFLRSKILPSPNEKYPDDIQLDYPERYHRNLTDCVCMMPVYY